RAAFEAARGPVGLPVARPALPAPTPSAAPAASASAAPAAKAGRSAAAAPPAAGAPTGAPSTALARTGFDNHIPLAGAGGFLALGGAAIIFGAPRRRRPARRSA
ncbi:MAG TPA: hypothetical protein VG034_26380, partial [Acidimicrobiia bacterium]|nr:hypothetical protein [Acidimicrobiia bacterium]